MNKYCSFRWVSMLLFGCLFAACVDRNVAGDKPQMSKDLDSIVKQIGIKPTALLPTIAKREVVSIGVAFVGKPDVAEVQWKIEEAASKAGYGLRDGAEHTVSGVAAFVFCHNDIAGRYLTWTKQDSSHALLQIYSQGNSRNYPYCSVH